MWQKLWEGTGELEGVIGYLEATEMAAEPVYPSCLHTESAAASPKSLAHTVPHLFPWCTSTLPDEGARVSVTSRTCPL